MLSPRGQSGLEAFLIFLAIILSHIEYNLHKNSFINRCLFNLRWIRWLLFSTPYTTFRPIPNHYPSTQLKLISSFIYTILFHVSYVCLCVGFFYSHNITMTLFTLLLFCACCFICRLYSYMDCLFSFYARPYVFMFYVTVCEFHIALKATWLDLTWLKSYVVNHYLVFFS